MTDEQMSALLQRPSVQMVLDGLQDAGVFLPAAQKADFITAVEARRVQQVVKWRGHKAREVAE